MSDETPQTRRSSDTAIATLTERVGGLVDKVEEFRTDFCDRLEKVEKKIDEGYVTKAEFEPVRSLTFGAVKVVLATVLAALLGLVVMVKK